MESTIYVLAFASGFTAFVSGLIQSRIWVDNKKEKAAALEMFSTRLRSFEVKR